MTAGVDYSIREIIDTFSCKRDGYDSEHTDPNEPAGALERAEQLVGDIRLLIGDSNLALERRKTKVLRGGLDVRRQGYSTAVHLSVRLHW